MTKPGIALSIAFCPNQVFQCLGLFCCLVASAWFKMASKWACQSFSASCRNVLSCRCACLRWEDKERLGVSSMSSGSRRNARALTASIKSFWVQKAVRQRDQYQCLRYAFCTVGDHGIQLSGWHCLSAATRMHVRHELTHLSSCKLASERCCFCIRASMHLAIWCLLHSFMVLVQNFLMCNSCLRLTPSRRAVAGQRVPKQGIGVEVKAQ